jgi:predicted DCC family thiol-disulfide oxidoreductase YuxK
MKPTNNILFYDSNCLICNRFIMFLFLKDKDKILFFSNFTSKTAIDNNISITLNTMLLIKNGNKYIKSRAFIELFSLLKIYPPLILILKFFPANLLDIFYEVISKNRTKFRINNSCNLPIKKQILN